MAIHKRKSVPVEDATEASEHTEDASTARHPHLTGLRQDVYYFVQANQPCTRSDVAKGVRLPNNVATARVKELIDEGFLIEPIGIRKRNSSGVNAKVLMVSDRKQGGSPLDKVRIEVKLTIDHNGVYGVAAEVVGGQRQHGPAHVIKRQRVTLTAPHPDTYKAITAPEQVTEISRFDSQYNAGDIIEGTVTILKD